MNTQALPAIRGGTATRAAPMPPRFAFGAAELNEVEHVFDYYRKLGSDFGFQGHFERLYTDAFVDYQGEGGYADAVATGTAAIYVALAALDLPPGSEVLCSPISDPGTFSAIVLNGLRPRLVDCEPGRYVIGPAEVKARISSNTRAIVVVHASGIAAEIDAITALSHDANLKVVEDCSQAHGATWAGRKVGCFGDVAAFSTMYRKNHATGGAGGVIYSKDEELYRQCLARADRGKPTWHDDFDEKDPASFLFPALNLHTDELSCAIGRSSLSRLDDTITRRRAVVQGIANGLAQGSRTCRAAKMGEGCSPFFLPVHVATQHLPVNKVEFARAVAAEGIPINPHYRYVASDWPWLRPYLADDFPCDRAREVRDTTFNILLNENYGFQEVEDILNAIRKVERFLA
jgi:dTDP-4-amino-4,6-dideoxygalactose transaminase